MADATRFLPRLGAALGSRRWALTLLAGAWRRIRYTPTDVLHVYLECASIAELRRIAARNHWPEDRAGRLVLMKPSYRDSVWSGVSPNTAGKPESAPVVSDLQLIVDLWSYPERGRETAMQLWRPMLQRFERVAPKRVGAAK